MDKIWSILRVDEVESRQFKAARPRPAAYEILSTSEIIQDLDLEVEPKELCAAAEADYDERKETIIIKLDAFVRQVHHAGPDVCSRPDWLPKQETLREGVSLDEASDMAREIFRRWTRKVRDSVETAGTQQNA